MGDMPSLLGLLVLLYADDEEMKRWLLMTLAVCLEVMHAVCSTTESLGVCMVDKYLPVFVSIEDTNNPDQISNSIGRNAALNLQGTSAMLHCCLHTLMVVPLTSPLANKLHSSTAKWFRF